MPVVVTGADGPVGRALVPLLVARGSEVRAIVPRKELAEPLRSAGAKVAAADLDDPDTLGAVFHDAHSLCHLREAIDAERVSFDDGSGSTDAVVTVAAEAGIRRLLLLSCVGADPAAAAAYLRARSGAEERVRASGIAHVIVRASFAYGTGSAWLVHVRAAATGRRISVVAPGNQRLAPVLATDVAAVLAAADDRAAPPEGTFAIGGPDVVTADRLAELLAGREGKKRHVRAPRGMPPALADVLAVDALPDAPNAAREFGVRLRPLEVGLASVLGVAQWGG